MGENNENVFELPCHSDCSSKFYPCIHIFIYFRKNKKIKNKKLWGKTMKMYSNCLVTQIAHPNSIHVLIYFLKWRFRSEYWSICHKKNLIQKQQTNQAYYCKRCYFRVTKFSRLAAQKHIRGLLNSRWAECSLVILVLHNVNIIQWMIHLHVCM